METRNTKGHTMTRKITWHSQGQDFAVGAVFGFHTRWAAASSPKDESGEHGPSEIRLALYRSTWNVSVDGMPVAKIERCRDAGCDLRGAGCKCVRQEAATAFWTVRNQWIADLPHRLATKTEATR